MTTLHVVTGLMTKRAELAALLEHHQAKVRQLMIDLDAIDQALRLFNPDIELSEIKPRPIPPRHAAYKGEIARVVLDNLCDAKRACTTQELTMHLVAERGMNTADKRLVKAVTKRVGACLRHHQTKKLIRSVDGFENRIAWEVV